MVKKRLGDPSAPSTPSLFRGRIDGSSEGKATLTVNVVSRRRLSGVRVARLREDAGWLLRALGEPRAELTLTLVGDAEIHRLNRDYRRTDRPTDVLAFAMREGLRAPGDSSELGDVVISLETAARQARQRGAPAAEVRALLVHGVLHLLGYDHERSAAEARHMRALERQLRASLEPSARPLRRACLRRARRE